MIWSLVAWHIALAPFAWLTWQVITNQPTPADVWWIAGVFGVSWLADCAARWLDPNVIGNIYPLSQAALIGMVVLQARYADWLLTFLIVTALVAVFWRGADGQDVFFRTVAWGAIVGMAYTTTDLGRYRTMLLATFGLGLVTWIAHVAYVEAHPLLHGGAPTWYVYQGTRALGIALFCWATTGPTLHLTDA